MVDNEHTAWQRSAMEFETDMLGLTSFAYSGAGDECLHLHSDRGGCRASGRTSRTAATRRRRPRLGTRAAPDECMDLLSPPLDAKVAAVKERGHEHCSGMLVTGTCAHDLKNARAVLLHRHRK